MYIYACVGKDCVRACVGLGGAPRDCLKGGGQDAISSVARLNLARPSGNTLMVRSVLS